MTKTLTQQKLLNTVVAMFPDSDLDDDHSVEELLSYCAGQVGDLRQAADALALEIELLTTAWHEAEACDHSHFVELEACQEALRAVQPFVQMPSDVYPQHQEALGRARMAMTKALAGDD